MIILLIRTEDSKHLQDLSTQFYNVSGSSQDLLAKLGGEKVKVWEGSKNFLTMVGLGKVLLKKKKKKKIWNFPFLGFDPPPVKIWNFFFFFGFLDVSAHLEHI